MRHRLTTIGIDCGDEQLREVTERVRSRARSSNRVLTDADLRDIAGEIGLG